jgi:hypothetical protein
MSEFGNPEGPLAGLMPGRTSCQMRLFVVFKTVRLKDMAAAKRERPA